MKKQTEKANSTTALRLTVYGTEINKLVIIGSFQLRSNFGPQ